MNACVDRALVDGADVRFPLPSVPIERRAAVQRDEFEREYMAGIGKPVIVTDAAVNWPALRTWTFESLAQRCGDSMVVVKDSLFNPSDCRLIQLRKFLLYCQHPWTSQLCEAATGTPFYVSFKPFGKYPDMLDDFEQPYFFDNFYEELPREYRAWFLKFFSYLFLGPSGTVTPLHVDLYMTHAWLTQIAGRKHLLLFSPADRELVYHGAVDPLHPDLAKYPRFSEATAYEAVLEPGETVLFPAGWYHHVVSLDPSISLSFNGVNRTNIIAHILSISENLPRWARQVNLTDFRDAAQLRWTAKDFEVLERDQAAGKS
jgi:hypothetical protein